MNGWPDHRLLNRLKIDVPILQAPMAGSTGSALAIAVCEAGGLGALPCAMLSVEQARADLAAIRAKTARPFNVNFFCHRPPADDPAREAAWRQRLDPYYVELGIDPALPIPRSQRAPFDNAYCELVEEFRPAVVSFHFGLPERALFQRVKATGAIVLCSATTVAEARWLEDAGCDAIIAQGIEAGGHRGIFLSSDLSTQLGTMALVPQIVDAVRLPVIAAGGIMDGRGIAAALTLGASAVQIGTAYLFCPEATLSAIHRRAIENAGDTPTALTNVLTGRPARGLVNRLVREVGPLNAGAPEFPLAAGAIMPLRAAAEKSGSGEFSPLWAGQAVRMGRSMPAATLTRKLADEALRQIEG